MSVTKVWEETYSPSSVEKLLFLGNFTEKYFIQNIFIPESSTGHDETGETLEKDQRDLYIL